MLTTLTIAALLGGCLLGLRFKVYVLIPAILLSLPVVVIIGVELDSTIPAILAAALLTMTGLQIGYCVATAVAFMLPRSASAHGLKKLRWRKGH